MRPKRRRPFRPIPHQRRTTPKSFGLESLRRRQLQRSLNETNQREWHRAHRPDHRKAGGSRLMKQLAWPAATSAGWSMSARPPCRTPTGIMTSAEPISIRPFRSHARERTRLAMACRIGPDTRISHPGVGQPTWSGWQVGEATPPITPATCSCTSTVWSVASSSISRTKMPRILSRKFGGCSHFTLTTTRSDAIWVSSSTLRCLPKPTSTLSSRFSRSRAGNYHSHSNTQSEPGSTKART